jgi:3-phosphoshikimate 1-carboxyvinyltransferase
MQLIAKKSRLKGSVTVPGSKSHTIRAVVVASLAEGKSVIRGPLTSGDTLSAVNCYRALGAEIDTANSNLWKVTGTAGQIHPSAETIDVGNSGTTLNLALGSAALAPDGQTTNFTGDAQIQSRSSEPLIRSLNELGAKCISIRNNGKPPVAVTGRLKGGRTSISAVSSQYLSSLLMCTPLADNDSDIDVTLLNEPGYVQMTLDWLNKQSIEYQNDGMRRFKVKGGQKYKAFDTAIPADFSSATFFLCVAALVGDEVKLLGLDFSDSQPDKAVVEYLRAMGADITVDKNQIMVKASPLKGTEIDMNATPDALPAMAVVGIFAEGETRLVNVPQARGKETDRIKCMAEELGKLGVEVKEFEDGLIIRHSLPTGAGKSMAARLDGRGDHRIVMALALAGMAGEAQCIIDTAEAMNVTFPQFVELMTSIGAVLELK